MTNIDSKLNNAMSPRFANEQSWSNSKCDIFNRCRREYFFDKIVSRNGWDKSQASKFEREAYVLKNTRNRYAWGGDLVHVAIEGWVDAFKKGKHIDRDAFLAKADSMMRQQFRESRDQKYREIPKKFTGLIEHEYSMNIPDSEWRSVHENVQNCLINFFYTELYKEITLTGIEGVVKPERLDFFMLDNVKVYARPDVAIKGKNIIRLVDWKTGKENDDNDLQMVYYALYAVRKLKYPIEAIVPDIVYLKDNINKRVSITSEIIDNAASFILASHGEMVSFEKEFTKSTPPGSVPAAVSVHTCRMCRFKKLCTGMARED